MIKITIIITHKTIPEIKRLNQKSKIVSIIKKQNIEIKKGVNKINKNIEKADNSNNVQHPLNKKKTSLLENVSKGIKNVFRRSFSKNQKNK